MSKSPIGPISLLVLLASFAGPLVTATAPLKCCEHGHVLGDDFDECVQVDDALYETGYRRILKELDFAANATRLKMCFQDSNSSHPDENHPTTTSNAFATCIDFRKNGTLAYLACWNISGKSTKDQCDSIFTFLTMYGAKMMVFANIIYLFIYTPVVLVYIIIPGVIRRAYDKVVLTFVFVEIVLSCVIITLGHFMLCHKSLSRLTAALFGISLMSLTIASVLLLLLISFDVASTITKFRWAPSSGPKGRDENHKFRVYLVWLFIGTFVPVSISTTLQFSSLPDESIFHPTFHNLTSLNYRVIVHVVTVPVLVAIASNALFIYTTVKMINIQKSSSLANENRKASVKKKYILYLKLYLLMDAPYITGALGSSVEDLWILKFGRLVQPIFLVYAVIPRSVVNAFSCKKKPQDIPLNPRENVA